MVADHATIAHKLFSLMCKDGKLKQEDASDFVYKKFGYKYVIETDAGGLAIHRQIRRAMRDLFGHAVRWNPGHRHWEFNDLAGK